MTISTIEFERLAKIAGVSEYDDWKRQIARLKELPQFLSGTIQQAWQRCWPEWTAVGRVRDLSLCVQVPKYWPHFANTLGHSFVQRFRDDDEFLIRRLDEYQFDSTEYLCTADLIEFMFSEHEYDDSSPVRDRLFALTNPLPPVVQYECRCSKRYSNHAGSLGQFLRRKFASNHEGAESESDRAMPPDQLEAVRDFYLGSNRHPNS